MYETQLTLEALLHDLLSNGFFFHARGSHVDVLLVELVVFGSDFKLGQAGSIPHRLNAASLAVFIATITTEETEQTQPNDRSQCCCWIYV